MRVNKIFIALAIILGLTSCNSTPNSNDSSSNQSTSISQSNKLVIHGKNEIGIREYIQLTATYNDETCDVNYVSSNEDVATVSSSGMVKGLSVGQTTIHASLKKDSSIFTDFTITVRESMNPHNVLNRFIRAKSYKTKATGTIKLNNTNYDLSFEEYFYETSYEVRTKSDLFVPSFGLSQDINNGYNYILNSNNEIESATYFRRGIADHRSTVYELSDLPLGYFSNASIAENDIYEVKNSDFINVFGMILLQNMKDSNAMSVIASSLNPSTTNASLTFTILTPYSFKVDYNFDNQKNDIAFSITYSDIGDEENTLLNDYLKTHSVIMPEVYEDILKIDELVKGHNYIRELGDYKKSNGKTFSIGQCIYTEDYVLFDYSDEYIEETKDLYNYVDHGLINISGKSDYPDGVYTFQAVKDEFGNEEFELTGIITDTGYLGLRYMKYYDFFENITLIMEQMSPVYYSFEKMKTQDYGDDFNEYASYTVFGSYITQDLFDDYITALNLTSEGIILSVKYDESNPSNSVVNYGGLFSFSGYSTYIYSEYEFTGFGTASSPSVDNFLASIN